MFTQRLQFVLLIERILCTKHFKPGLVLEDKCDGLFWNECSFAEKWGRDSMDSQPQILES
jgi:hypothetical protein